MKTLLHLLVIALLGVGSLTAASQPNVLFIAVDDLNVWLGHIGRNPQTRTPNIDRLAARGVSFTRAYCAVPACEPARAALMSGKRPWTTACYQNGDTWKKHLTEGEQLNAQFLKAGYHVAGAGKIYHSDLYFESEWSEYQPRAGLHEHGEGVAKDEGFHDPVAHDLKDEDIMDWHSVNYTIERLSKKSDQPFFLACGLHKPHLPFAVPRKYYEPFPLDGIQLPPYLKDDLADVPPAGVKMAKPDADHRKLVESGRWKAAIQSYLACVSYTDMNIGRLLDALDKSPNRDNTIIVFWGDHGWSFGEKDHWRKFALWEEPTRAPFIVVAPGVTKPGALCDRPVDFMGIYPTLCDLAGLKIPAHVEGATLRPLLANPKAEWGLPAITTHGRGNHAVRTSQWRYIRYADGSEELYDHTKDEYEWTNLADNPEFKQTKIHLAASLPKTEAPVRMAGDKAPATTKPSKNKKQKN